MQASTQSSKPHLPHLLWHASFWSLIWLLFGSVLTSIMHMVWFEYGSSIQIMQFDCRISLISNKQACAITWLEGFVCDQLVSTPLMRWLWLLAWNRHGLHSLDFCTEYYLWCSDWLKLQRWQVVAAKNPVLFLSLTIYVVQNVAYCYSLLPKQCRHFCIDDWNM